MRWSACGARRVVNTFAGSSVVAVVAVTGARVIRRECRRPLSPWKSPNPQMYKYTCKCISAKPSGRRPMGMITANQSLRCFTKPPYIHSFIHYQITLLWKTPFWGMSSSIKNNQMRHIFNLCICVELFSKLVFNSPLPLLGWCPPNLINQIQYLFYPQLCTCPPMR